MPIKSEQKRSNTDILFDSVYAINQVLSKTDEEASARKTVLDLNAKHIRLCLKKEEYTKVLTSTQVSTLTATALSAETAFAKYSN